MSKIIKPRWMKTLSSMLETERRRGELNVYLLRFYDAEDEEKFLMALITPPVLGEAHAMQWAQETHQVDEPFVSQTLV